MLCHQYTLGDQGKICGSLSLAPTLRNFTSRESQTKPNCKRRLNVKALRTKLKEHGNPVAQNDCAKAVGDGDGRLQQKSQTCSVTESRMMEVQLNQQSIGQHQRRILSISNR
jgi:hypothetical protein